MHNDDNTAPGWAMKDDADMSWQPVGWPRWSQWAIIAVALAMVAFNAVRLWG